MSTNVYIDGFNLFRGCLKGSPYKWLNLELLCQTLLPGQNIKRIRFFTARVLPFSHNADAPANQLIYLRALETLPSVIVHDDGWFSKHAVKLPVAPMVYPDGPTLPPTFAKVLKLEEKRTDVDIASHLLLDCFDGDFDQAAVISNDSDLCLPIETVRVKFGKPITVINPHSPKWLSGQLVKAATTSLRTINKSVLINSQLPDSLTDAIGTFTKPLAW